METLDTRDPLVKIVPADTAPSNHSPYWTKEAEFDAAVKAGKNLSDHFGLPIVSEAPRYDVYRITPKVPTQVFINTVAPTTELGGAVTKAGGAEQALVPNRELFHDPVYVRSVDNTLTLAATVDRGGLSPNLVRGAGVLGTAAVAYDATMTVSHAVDLHRQGNVTGMQSTVMRFGGRTVGMLAGAEIGAATGAALGVETGPGLLLTGAVGGVIGAVGGDALVNAVNRHRVYNQPDADGHTWHYQPDHPERGWQRVALDAPDAAERAGNHQSSRQWRTFAADPVLSDALSYKASNTAVELALAHPAMPRDPYTIPSNERDARSLREAPWTRDPATHQWTRHVAEGLLDPRVMGYRTDVAAPSRAAELERASQAIIADNLSHSPQTIARNYQEAYEQRGWQRHGSMPDAVINALKMPADILQASDGHTYTRGQDGQWRTPGTLWGMSTAEGNVRHELDSIFASAQARSASQSATPLLGAQAQAEPTKTVQAMPAPSQDYLAASAAIQRITKAMEQGDMKTLRMEGEAFTQSARGQTILEQARIIAQREEHQRTHREAQQLPRDARDARHPDHALNQDIRKQVETQHCRAGIFITNRVLDHLTASVAQDVRKQGMSRVDQLHFNTDRTSLIAEQKGSACDVVSKHSITNIQQAMQAPPEQSYHRMTQETQRQAHIQQTSQQNARSRQEPLQGR